MKILTVAFILSFCVQVFAQTTLTGVVKDAKNEKLAGTNIYLKGTYDGITSDTAGNFHLLTEEIGKQILVVQALGFQTQEISIECDGAAQYFNITLLESINVLTAVTITAGSLEANDQKKAIVLKPIDIVTTAGAIGDITGALLTLPGTTTVGNDGRLFVRGGDASETGLYMDGMQIGNAFGTTASNVPTRTRFSPNLFKGTFFSTGGYSAEFGQALSSALALNTLDMPLRNQTDISIMSLGGGVSQTWVGTSQAVIASANYVNLAPYYGLMKQNFDWEKSPASWDSEISLRQKWGKNGIIKAYGHVEGSSMAIWQQIPGQHDRGQKIAIDNGYRYGNITFQKETEGNWHMSGGISYSANRDDVKLDGISMLRTNKQVHVKWVAEKYFYTPFAVKHGLEWYAKKYKETVVDEQRNQSFSDHQLNHFVESNYYFSNRLIARAGVRSGYSTLAKQFWMDPRFSMAYQLKNRAQISGAVGKFNQFPEEKLRIVDANLKNTEALHYLLNYFHVWQNRTFRVETFYKKYAHLATFGGTVDRPLNPALNGAGDAKGIDFFYRDKKTFRGMDFWVTYSYVDSKRKYAHYASKVQPSFAPKHNGSVVAKHYVVALKSQLGSSWSWNSGYTYHDPNQSVEMQGKTRMYSDLSISWSYLPRPHIIVHAACSNVLGRENVFGYRYANEPDLTGFYPHIPVQQGAKRLIFLAVFITISKDKTANNLNNL
jgi:hypothetical protein